MQFVKKGFFKISGQISKLDYVLEVDVKKYFYTHKNVVSLHPDQ